MSVASSMSLSSARSKVDFKVFDRLKQDSEDIDAALNEFLSERNYTLENQVQARLKYEADMKELDNSENHHEDVDHNLMRHLNLAIEGANEGNIDYDDFNGPSFEFDEPKELPPVRRKKRDHPNAIFDQPVGETKKVIPSFNEKIKIREKLLKFFDESRLQELQLVRISAISLIKTVKSKENV